MLALEVGSSIENLDCFDSPRQHLPRDASSSLGYGPRGHLDVREHLVLPETNDAPPGRFQFYGLPSVSGHVRSQSLAPVLGPGAGADVVLRAAVPEAAIDEDRDARAGEQEVRAPDGRPFVGLGLDPACSKSIAEAKLGSGVAAPDAGHLLGAGQRHGSVDSAPMRRLSLIPT